MRCDTNNPNRYKPRGRGKGEGGMALGDKLGESSGRITGTRVLGPEGRQVKVEVSFEGRGTMLGEDIADMGTYWQTLRPGGVLYGKATPFG